MKQNNKKTKQKNNALVMQYILKSTTHTHRAMAVWYRVIVSHPNQSSSHFFQTPDQFYSYRSQSSSSCTKYYFPCYWFSHQINGAVWVAAHKQFHPPKKWRDEMEIAEREIIKWWNRLESDSEIVQLDCFAKWNGESKRGTWSEQRVERGNGNMTEMRGKDSYCLKSTDK